MAFGTREDAPLLGSLGSLGATDAYWKRLLSVPREIIPLSLTAFGGPPAHIALAHDRCVREFQLQIKQHFLFYAVRSLMVGACVADSR